MKKKDFQYVVIGSGAAGAAGALLAARAGLKTALVESGKWGGATVNTRDVAYGAALGFSHAYARAVRGASFGISSKSLHYNYPTAVNWRNLAIKRAGGGDRKIFEEVGITCLHGLAHFLSPHEIAVGDQRITGAKFLIATGSKLADHGITGVEMVQCLTPDTAFAPLRVPRAVLVVGAGSTGCEIAQYYAELGARVLLVDIGERILQQEDPEVSQLMEQYFERMQIKVLTNSRVVAVEEDVTSKKVVFIRGGQEKSVRVDSIVLATGMKAATDLGLNNAGVKLNARGIKTNANLQTSCKHIWAAGDVLGGESSQAKAVYEASLVTGNIVQRKKAVVNYSGFMRVTNSFPQIVKVGMSEIEARLLKRKFRSSVVQLSEVGAANVTNWSVGFVKMLVDAKNTLVGATIVAPQAALVAQELSLAIRHGLNVQELASTPHSTMFWGEAVRQAALRLVK